MKIIKIIRLVCSFLICILCLGCGQNGEADVDEERVIQCITVTDYGKEDSDVIICIDIDFLGQKKQITEYRGKDVSRQEEDYVAEENFLRFIEERIILNDQGNSSKDNWQVEGKADEQRLLWRIVVQTSTESYYLKDFEEYPEFWEKLMEYLEAV